MGNEFCNFEKSVKNLINLDNKIIIFINYYKHKVKTQHDSKNRVVSILNKTRKSMIDLYNYHEFILKLTEKYQPQRLDEVLRNHLKRSRPVGETDDQFNQLNKYSRRKKRDEEVENQYQCTENEAFHKGFLQ